MKYQFGGPVRRKRVAAVLAALCVFGVPGVVGAQTASATETAPPVVDLGSSTSPSGATCRSFSVKVLQTPTDTVRQSVWVQRCYRGILYGTKPVQVLVHGGGYNHTYWDIPYNPIKYSYVYQATNQGYVTFNIDLLGAGNSDHPVGSTLTMDTNGYVVHQVVTALKAGKMGPAFSKVILNGHSMGAGAVQKEAENWKDVNGLIVSGIGHDLDPAVSTTVGPLLYPSQLDPKFAGNPQYVDYLTTLPGRRAEAFILPGTIEPGVNSAEEGVMKDLLTASELTSLQNDSYDPSLTPRITVPVLFVQGRYDELWCLRTRDCTTDPTANSEYTHWNTSFTRVIIGSAGHSINSSTTAPQFYTTTFCWLASHGLNY